MNNSNHVILHNTTQIQEKRKKIALAIPGDNFSSKFLISLTATLNNFRNSGKYDIIVITGVSSYVTFARMQTLGLDVLRGADQKPFNNSEFDYWITIDSDIIFTPDQVNSLIESLEIHPVVAGMYRMSNLTNYAIVKDSNLDYFFKKRAFEFLTPEYVEKWTKETSLKYMIVSYTGLGFFGMHSEVLKKMTYPYFNAELQEIIMKNGKIIRDICSEDVAFCKNIQKIGYQIVIDTSCIVGHYKNIII